MAADGTLAYDIDTFYQRRDLMSGFHYKDGRWYNPASRRFINESRAGVGSGETNLYLYKDNNPHKGRFDFESDPWEIAAQWGRTGVEVGASFMPGCGEAMDMLMLFGQDSAWWERALAGASLALSAATLTLAPNFAGIYRGSGRAARLAAAARDEVVVAAMRASDNVALRLSSSVVEVGAHLDGAAGLAHLAANVPAGVGYLDDAGRIVAGSFGDLGHAGVSTLDDVAAVGAARVGRSADELLANGVPHRTGGEFHRWFDDMTPDEFDRVWANPGGRQATGVNS